jgi:peptidoglycan hydrolase-like protein with peptidoglycan-binding domain
VLNDDQPVANQPYELRVDQRVYAGCTDPEGKLQVPIPGTAQRAYLTVGGEEKRLQYTLNLGGVDPIESIAGVQQRLKNLGYGTGSTEASELEGAIRAFQKHCGITPTGRADEPTREKLKYKHGC